MGKRLEKEGLITPGILVQERDISQDFMVSCRYASYAKQDELLLIYIFRYETLLRVNFLYRESLCLTYAYHTEIAFYRNGKTYMNNE